MEATTKTTTTTTTAKPRMRRNGRRSFSRSRSFSLCFKPVVMEDGSVAPTESAFTHDPVEPLPPKVVSFHVKGEKNKGSRHRLSRAIKAVLFETSLVKKAIKKKLQQHPKPEKISNEFPEREESLEDEEMGTASTVSSSLRFPSSITSAFLSPYSSCLSDRSVVAAENGKGYFGPNAGLSLLLMSLLIMIFWGKICAIFCASTWLFLVPRWSIKPSKTEKMMELPEPEIYSDLYKKKVIMKGLLERNRSLG